MLYNVYMRVIIGPDTTDKVIHNIYPDGLDYPKEMLDPNIGGWKNKCKHIYEYVYAKICPFCGRQTCEPDYERDHKLFKEYYESGKHLEYVCPLDGGTIRGWWSI